MKLEEIRAMIGDNPDAKGYGPKFGDTDEQTHAAVYMAVKRSLMDKLLAVAEAATAVNELVNFASMDKLDKALDALEEP